MVSRDDSNYVIMRISFSMDHGKNSSRKFCGKWSYLYYKVNACSWCKQRDNITQNQQSKRPYVTSMNTKVTQSHFVSAAEGCNYCTLSWTSQQF